MFQCNEAILCSNRDNKYFKYGHNGQILLIVMITKHIELQNIYTIVALIIILLDHNDTHAHIIVHQEEMHWQPLFPKYTLKSSTRAAIYM